jgi:hypothetical protein
MKFAIAALALLMQAGGGSAPAVDAERLEAARQLIATFRLDETLEANVRAFAGVSASEAAATIEREHGIDVPPDVEARLAEAAMQDGRDAIVIIRPAMERELAQRYAQHFTAPELRHLATAMSDPLMQRLTRTQPAIMRDVLPVVFAELPATQTSRVHAELQAWLRTRPASDEPARRTPSSR